MPGRTTWGPNARARLQELVEISPTWTAGPCPSPPSGPSRIAGKDVIAFRISYVGESASGKVDAGAGFGAEHRIQPARGRTGAPKVKEADFRGKAKHLEYKARLHQPAQLCTLVMTGNIDGRGAARYPVGILPILDPETGETLIDSLGRRSFTTWIAYGPSMGCNIMMAYLPHDCCRPGRTLMVDCFAETYPVEVAARSTTPSICGCGPEPGHRFPARFVSRRTLARVGVAGTLRSPALFPSLIKRKPKVSRHGAAAALLRRGP
ncbi:glycine cleavage T C-terminal barrel domain-containing protein [Paracoccus yeei]|uniref:glycine cleavage T C-terminal barrel domain-containing protein n=1 Tax=Paracoccus yeei TaxID=147645 RepID=UPI0020C4A92B|nr:glycine cleavage T C-terminal barrel domain-containing protein [Paracoccus yeei]